jgi:alpha-L-arabinofuranosidase
MNAWSPRVVAGILALAVAGCTDMAAINSPAAGNGVPAVDRPVTITVQADRPGPRVNPAMWGAFFEDINFGADGGLYAEMVKNRGFEFPDTLMGWYPMPSNVARGDVEIRSDTPFRDTNPHYLRVKSKAPAPMGLYNEGFRGMGVTAGEAYDFSAQLRAVDGTPRVTVELVAADGTTLASTPLTGISGTWSKVTATLKPKETDPKAHLTILVDGPSTVDVDWVSLFPQKTWKNRPGGLRADMVQALADLKPGFLRFPGGCVVEGAELALRYQWKNTIGPVEDRKLLVNRWNTEFKHRLTPDYYQSYGLGFFEFFQLCEDIGAAPLPIVNCGMACQFNSKEVCPPDELGPYIQDALDLIEFANGPATSPWGARRAAMGHPAPFHMTMMGVGNEQWGPEYIERLAIFTKAIKAKYPDITLVSDAGPSPADDRFHYLWPKLRELKADIVDEHCYANPIWFFSNATRFDHYDRNGPKVFFGEYAAQSVAIVSPRNKNNLECALAEAAYMTGMERNADVVRMASYAPLFSNADAWQWTPDLIWADSLRVARTPNYYVQQLYTHHRGDVVLPTTNDAPVAELLPAGRIGVGTRAAAGEFQNVRVTKADGSPIALPAFSAGGWTGGETWQAAGDVYRQGDERMSAVSYAGDPAWTNYTLSLRARKTAGAGGLVVAVYDDKAGARVQWILGGGGNARHELVSHYAEQDQVLGQVPGTLETGRWYDVRVVVNGAHVACYLDGQLVQQAEALRLRVPALFTSATRDEQTGDTILKVVNPGPQPARATVKLQGTAGLRGTGTATVLAGNLADENRLGDAPAVVPTTEPLAGAGATFGYTFRPRSMTVLRVK